MIVLGVRAKVLTPLFVAKNSYNCRMELIWSSLVAVTTGLIWGSQVLARRMRVKTHRDAAIRFYESGIQDCDHAQQCFRSAIAVGRLNNPNSDAGDKMQYYIDAGEKLRERAQASFKEAEWHRHKIDEIQDSKYRGKSVRRPSDEDQDLLWLRGEARIRSSEREVRGESVSEDSGSDRQGDGSDTGQETGEDGASFLFGQKTGEEAIQMRRNTSAKHLRQIYGLKRRGRVLGERMASAQDGLSQGLDELTKGLSLLNRTIRESNRRRQAGKGSQEAAAAV